MPLGVVSSWPWRATFESLRRRPNSEYLKFATGFTKVMEALSDLIAIAGLATALELTLTGREVTAEEAYRLRLVTKVVPHENLMETAEQYASMIMSNSQQAIRSAKETILDVVGRTLDDALRLETLNAYSSLGDFSEARERLSQFYSKGKAK